MCKKLEAARALLARAERDIGHPLENHLIDLMMDNAEELGFTDDDCLKYGNIIRADKGLSPVAKWW